MRLIRTGDLDQTRPVRRALPIVLALVAFSMSTDVRADDAAEARFFDGIARTAYEHRHWEEALEAFLRSYRAAPSSRALYNVALCAQLAHREPMAFAYFEEFLAQPDADATLRADAETRRASLSQTLALVHVESDPPGASIFVDRRDHGSFGRTPRTIALPAGAHHLELTLADHSDASADVEAAVGARHDVRAALAPHEGQLTVEVTPRDATLLARIGDVETAIPAGQPATLPVGVYSVVARAPGHRDASVDVRLVRDATERRVLSLEALPIPTGRLLVTTGDVHARVRIDGADRAESPARLEGITVGSHQIEIGADGYLPWSGEVTVDEDRTGFVSVTLVRER
jgi:outer membrane receptor for ferrienterochelin and colicins